MSPLINNRLILPFFLIAELPVATAISETSSKAYGEMLNHVYDRQSVIDQFETFRPNIFNVSTTVKVYDFRKLNMGKLNFDFSDDLQISSKAIFKRSGVFKAKLRKSSSPLKSLS